MKLLNKAEITEKNILSCSKLFIESGPLEYQIITQLIEEKFYNTILNSGKENKILFFFYLCNDILFKLKLNLKNEYVSKEEHQYDNRNKIDEYLDKQKIIQNLLSNTEKIKALNTEGMSQNVIV